MARVEIAAFLVGHPVLDAQHRALHELCSELSACPKNPVALGVQSIHGCLAQLVCLTLEHFATEERILAEFGYPFSHVHKDAHFEHVSVLSGIVAEGMQRGIDDHLAEKLENWLLDHLAGDREYAAFLTGT